MHLQHIHPLVRPPSRMRSYPRVHHINPEIHNEPQLGVEIGDYHSNTMAPFVPISNCAYNTSTFIPSSAPTTNNTLPSGVPFVQNPSYRAVNEGTSATVYPAASGSGNQTGFGTWNGGHSTGGMPAPNPSEGWGSAPPVGAGPAEVQYPVAPLESAM